MGYYLLVGIRSEEEERMLRLMVIKEKRESTRKGPCSAMAALVCLVCLVCHLQQSHLQDERENGMACLRCCSDLVKAGPRGLLYC